MKRSIIIGIIFFSFWKGALFGNIENKGLRSSTSSLETLVENVPRKYRETSRNLFNSFVTYPEDYKNGFMTLSEKDLLFHFAVTRGKFKLAEYFLSIGANINSSREGRGGLLVYCPLIHINMEKKKNISYCQFLLDHGADPNFMRERGIQIPLFNVVENRYYNYPYGDGLFDAFVNTGKCNFNLLNHRDKSLLWAALRSLNENVSSMRRPGFIVEQTRICRVLMEKGADPNFQVKNHIKEKTNFFSVFDEILKTKSKELMSTAIAHKLNVNDKLESLFHDWIGRTLRFDVLNILDGLDMFEVLLKKSTNLKAIFTSLKLKDPDDFFEKHAKDYVTSYKYTQKIKADSTYKDKPDRLKKILWTCFNKKDS